MRFHKPHFANSRIFLRTRKDGSFCFLRSAHRGGEERSRSLSVEYLEMLIKIRLSSLLAAVFAASTISVRGSRMMIRPLPTPTRRLQLVSLPSNVMTWGRLYRCS